jgi:hypothetical protein
MGILNPPPFPTADDEDADGTLDASAGPGVAEICAVAVSAAVSAGVHAALAALGETGSDGALAYDEAELLDAYRNAGELHRTTALRTLQRGADTKDES